MEIKKFKIGTNLYSSNLIVFLVLICFACVFLFAYLAETFENVDPGLIFAILCLFIFVGSFTYFVLNAKKRGSEFLTIISDRLEFSYPKRDNSLVIIEKLFIRNIVVSIKSGMYGFISYYLIKVNSSNKDLEFATFMEEGDLIIEELKKYNYPLT